MKDPKALTNKGQRGQLKRLTEMGFDETTARQSLEANDWDVDAAANDLLSGVEEGSRTGSLRKWLHQNEFDDEMWDNEQPSMVGHRHDLASSVKKSPGVVRDEESSSSPPKHPSRATSIGDSGIGKTTAPRFDREPEARYHVGAVAVAGPGIRDEPAAGDFESMDFDSAYICENSELVVASEVEPDASPPILQSRLVTADVARHERIHPIMQSEMVTAGVVPPESHPSSSAQSSYLAKDDSRPYLTKRRIMVALIALLLVLGGCAVAGVLLAKNKPDPDETEELIPDGGESTPGTTESSNFLH